LSVALPFPSIDSFTSADKTAFVTLLDLSGRVLISGHFSQVAAGNQTLIINVNNVLAGQYILRVYADNINETKHITIND